MALWVESQFDRAFKKVSGDFVKVLIFFLVIGILGVLGNLPSIHFYRKQPKKTINSYILALAVTDFWVSITAFVGVAETVINIKLESRLVCKSLWFLYYWCVGLSIGLVSVIAIDRFRGICLPQKPQVTVSQAKKIIAGTVISMMIMSLRAYLTVDLVKTQVVLNETSENFNEVPQTKVDGIGKVSPNLNGGVELNWLTTENALDIQNDAGDFDYFNVTVTKKQPTTVTSVLPTTATPPQQTNPRILVSNSTSSNIEVQICAFSKEPSLRSYVVAFHISDVVIVSMVIVINVFCYTNVIRTLVLHRKDTAWIHKKNKATRYLERTQELTQIISKDISSISKELTNNKDYAESKELKNGNKQNFSKQRTQHNLTVKSTSNKVNVRSSEVQTTIAMSIVSLALLISFVPYFISTIYIQFLSTEDNALDTYSILLVRSPFINSVVNCFIYYIFSTPYRKFINELVCAPCVKKQ